VRESVGERGRGARREKERERERARERENRVDERVLPRVSCDEVSERVPRNQQARHLFRPQASGFRVHSAGFRVQDSGSRVQGSGFRVQGSGRRNEVSQPVPRHQEARHLLRRFGCGVSRDCWNRWRRPNTA
jgi:hypothetical protein